MILLTALSCRGAKFSTRLGSALEGERQPETPPGQMAGANADRLVAKRVDGCARRSEHKPDIIPRKLNKEKQQAFIESYDNLLNSLADNEAVLFADAVHPTHATRPAGCWAPRQEKLAIEQTSGRERINIHGAIDLATGQTRMIEVVTVDAVSTIRLLELIAALYPMLALIHVFLDNARYHHAKLVQEWLARPGCRIKLHFIPSYCPHLNPIERLWGLMHRNVTHYLEASAPWLIGPRGAPHLSRTRASPGRQGPAGGKYFCASDTNASL